MTIIDPWYLENLVCPLDQHRLTFTGEYLVCASGHNYPVVNGMPVMLLAEIAQTMALAESSMQSARSWAGKNVHTSELFLESIGINAQERAGVIALAQGDGSMDPVVAYLVAATNGMAYRHLVGKLDTYPIPEIPLPSGRCQRLLDVGCSWGRWSIAASQRGYEVVGIDPSLGAVMAARRVAKKLGAPIRYLVADARHLPFPGESFDTTFSYSVLQHFMPEDVERSVAEMGRVLKPSGISMVQMPTRYGIRCFYHQLRRGFRHPVDFEVRYWTLRKLSCLFKRWIGRTSFNVDCYFGIGLQRSDTHLMTWMLKSVILASECLKEVSRHVPALVWMADSVFVQSTKPAVSMQHALRRS